MPTLSISGGEVTPDATPFGPGPVKKPRKKETRPRAKRVMMKPDGRQPHEPTPAQRKIVMVFRAVGMPLPEIAHQLGMSVNTMTKHYAEELAHGHVHGEGGHQH